MSDIKLCSVEGCSNRHKAKTYCMNHYNKLVSRSSDGYIPVPWKEKSTVEERFWQKVDKSTGDDGCWEWQGSIKTSKNGRRIYGRFHDGKRHIGAHRYSYQLHNKVTLTSATPVHHKCGNSICQNPRHLQVTTPEENTAEMLERYWYQARIAELEAQLAECTCVVNT